MSRHLSLKSLIAIIGSLMLTACADGFLQPQYPIAHRIAPEMGLTQYNDPLLANARQTRVSYLGAFEYVDYARYETSEVVLESVYDVATSIMTVLDYHWTMSRMANTWNVNAGKGITLGAPASVGAWSGSIDYRPYRLAAGNRNCIAFQSEWAFQARDMEGRPTRVYFGYACAQPGKNVSTEALAGIVASVRFSGKPRESLIPVDSRRSIDPIAISEAKGTPGGTTGDAEFPFNFGTVYQEGDGPERTS